ncbi:hypothetical protein AGMMS49949_06680 [Alphaproteobacteria bacterium]|nr:hypothetical protein AGMMS49949_06680 [Alphaproteobacteria bacterium]GHS98038.1 hypothetical protein AGMMS50296_5460 [Alphaproteobacteria bacterium]
MHRHKTIDLLQRYVPEDPVELRDKQIMLEVLACEPYCFERSCLEGHFTASCWFENCKGNAALLTHHKKFGDWLQLGGHADGDSDLRRVSLKEAFEELGVSALEFVQSEIFDIGVHFIPPFEDVPEHYHYDVRFYVRAIKDEDFVVSEESYALKWVFLDEEESLPNNYALKRMFAKWKNLKSGKLWDLASKQDVS